MSSLPFLASRSMIRSARLFNVRKWLGTTLGLFVALLIAWGPPQSQAQAQGGDVIVFAAASLKNAIDAINAQWQKETGKKAIISYGATNLRNRRD